ncbi:hypothetical protein FSPOR_9203 [Fusarium sporotrichioides]|uniref:Ubiquitin-like domain-containing protein n=1 Tax=Fusarium sporotrichioides TaxID=5514 RepID=A0A395RRJ3_FUSSP|nr:hypothetical protein FSPOR_9203 [Fusarium sporotrichioides]
MADLNMPGIAQLGSNLSSSLDLKAETCRRARRNGFPKLVSLINSTSSTLRKVHELTQQSPDVFTEVCINDIDSLGATCRVLYEGILFLLVHREENHEDGKEIGRMKQERVESDFSSLMNKDFSGFKIWEWLGPRLEICQQELRQVKLELTLRFLLGSIAKYQLSTAIRSPGDWEKERSMRLFAENIAKKRVAHHKSSVTVAPSPIQVKAVIPDKNESADVGKDIKSEVSNALPDTAKTTPQEKEDDTSSFSDVTSYLNTRSQNWFQRLFTRNSRDEWFYEDIEAYTLNISHGHKQFAKMPLEEEEVLSTLRKLTKKRFWNKRPGLMEQYASLERTIRQDVDEVISFAKQRSSREMTLVAMEARKRDSSAGVNTGVYYTSEISITLFFKLGQSYAPIYIVYPNGEKWSVPYTSCETVKMIKDLIPKLGRIPINMHSAIVSGSYMISTDNKMSVTPETWDSIRRPGMILRLIGLGCPPVGTRMVPPPPGFNPSHPPPPPPGFPKRTTMADVYQEMNDLLKLSRPWTPGKETMKHAGLGNLLRLWTNAIDPSTRDYDDLSEWSCSSDSDS